MNELIAGGLAGVTQVAVGYPLDTVKVCLVSKTPIVWKNVYRGSMSPMVGAVLINAQTFYTYDYFRSKNLNVFNSGFLVGLGISIIESPVELIKIRMQTSTSTTYSGMIKEIGLRRMYHGFTATSWRNGFALGIYFYSYEKTMGLFTDRITGSLFGGFVAGVSCWIIPYPIDYMKTQIQADKTYKRNMRSYLDSTLRTNMFRGILPCIARAALVNPFIFLTYEVAHSMLNKN